MPTPDDFQALIGHKCRRPGCRNLAFGRRKNCEEHRKHNLARQILCRLHPAHEHLAFDEVEHQIEALPPSSGLASAVVSDQLDELDRFLELRGPGDSQEHKRAWRKALILSVVLYHQQPSTDRNGLLARCCGIIRDFGSFTIRDSGGFETPDISVPLWYGWEAVKLYRRLHDYPNVATALNAYGLLWRLVNREDITERMTHRALDILRGYFHDVDVRIAPELHNTLSWNLRLRRDYGSGLELDRDRLLFAKLGDESQFPTIQVDTHRVLARLRTAEGKRKEPFDEIEKMEKIRSKYELPLYDESAILRVEIEALLAVGDMIEAGKLISSKYVPLYEERDRHFWSRRTIMGWMRIPKLNFAVKLHGAKYFSADLSFLPRQRRKAE